MSLNGRLAASELTQVQRGPMNICLANAAARAWLALKSEYDRTHPGESLSIAAPVGGYRPYSVQVDMHVRPELYGLSAYSTVPLAPAGYSTHGDGLAVDIANASMPSLRKTWLLDHAARFGFTRQFGDDDPNHYRLTSTAAADVTPIKTRSNEMSKLYHKADSTPTLYALAGDSPGTPANWLETTAQGLANDWSGQIGGPSAAINAATWDTYKAAYLSPLTVAGGTGGGASKADVDAAADRVIAKVPTAEQIAETVNTDAAQRMQS